MELLGSECRCRAACRCFSFQTVLPGGRTSLQCLPQRGVSCCLVSPCFLIKKRINESASPNVPHGLGHATATLRRSSNTLLKAMSTTPKEESDGGKRCQPHTHRSSFHIEGTNATSREKLLAGRIRLMKQGHWAALLP